MWTTSACISLARDTGVPVFAAPERQRAASIDFGGMHVGSSAGVVQPRDVRELAAVVDWAGARSLSLTVRGAGLSQSGQSIAMNSLTIDTSRLDWIIEQQLPSAARDGKLFCGAGLSWGRLLDFSSAKSRVPYVFPLNPDLTVGGVASAGGIGPTSHRHGLFVSGVSSLEVVTGTGEVLICTPTANRMLFDACLSGLGRVGVIASVEIPVTKIPHRILHIQLLYDDCKTWMTDQKLLAGESDVVYMESFCWAGAKGTRVGPHGRRQFCRWMFSISLGVELDRDGCVASWKTLERLAHREVLGIEEEEPLYVLSRQKSRFELMRNSGFWSSSHPWVEVFFPLSDDFAETVEEVLDMLSVSLGDGHRMNMVAKANWPSLMTSLDGEDSHVGLFALLPLGVQEHDLSATIDAVGKIDRIFRERGGKRYLSGWLGDPDIRYWKAHFGDTFDSWSGAKQQFDPRNVFTSLLFANK